MNTAISLIESSFKALDQSDLYYGHGTDNAWDEACFLVCHLLDLPLDIDQSDPRLTSPVTDGQEKAIDAALKKRIAERLPMSYILNACYFAECYFYVDQRVIVPRSPFAEMILNGFSPWLDIEKCTDVLDLCTGSGCIAIACAKHFPHLKVDAVELSDDAYAVAQKNVHLHQVKDQVCIYQGDLYQPLEKDKQYDVIISNPPYVSDAFMQDLPKEYLHEPDMALRAKDDGLAIAHQIIAHAKARLKDGGVLFLEVGVAQEALSKAYPDLPFVWLEFAHGGEGICMIYKEDLN